MRTEVAVPGAGAKRCRPLDGTAARIEPTAIGGGPRSDPAPPVAIMVARTFSAAPARRSDPRFLRPGCDCPVRRRCRLFSLRLPEQLVAGRVFRADDDDDLWLWRHRPRSRPSRPDHRRNGADGGGNQLYRHLYRDGRVAADPRAMGADA